MELHNIEPIYDNRSKILILGSFPSVRSREQQFYYAHAQNRFWRVISAVFEQDTPKSVDKKRAFLLDNGIALWDCIKCCEINGSSDASIKNAKPNDIGMILRSCDIKAVFTNGKTSYNIYNKLILPKTNFEAVCLPSTSPANAAYSLERLTNEWSCAIKSALK
ncbi:MAG: DNA-deoxyinosine glycosylase [Acutalibacteraceae bacterium]